MDLAKRRARYYGGRKQFMNAVRVNRKPITITDVENIENDTGKGCMAGVERFKHYLEMNGLEILIRPVP